MTAPTDAIESAATRGRSSTRSHHHTQCSAIDPPESGGSFSTTDTIPRSLSPSARASKYAAEVLKAYKRRLPWQYTDTGGLSDPPGIRCIVTSMPYNYPKLGLSGYYSGNIDTVTKLPDGEGVLCCHDGTRIEGDWYLGELGATCSVPIWRAGGSDSSSLPCNSSTCSSLSASVTRQTSREAVHETKKVKIPKNFVIVIHTPMKIDYRDKDDVNTGIFKAPRSTFTRMVSRGNVSEKTERTCPISRMDSVDSGRYRYESKKSFKPLGVVSKVKTSIHSIRRRV
eukprot:CCRYP_013838-RA/>CCRYP_013838-RA protein AED:0.27 eAED:0.27 QI:0/-1/0/1/-1/1/1/0/282